MKSKTVGSITSPQNLQPPTLPRQQHREKAESHKGGDAEEEVAVPASCRQNHGKPTGNPYTRSPDSSLAGVQVQLFLTLRIDHKRGVNSLDLKWTMYFFFMIVITHAAYLELLCYLQACMSSGLT